MYYPLWIWLRDLFWGKSLGRARMLLSMSIAYVLLLGAASMWAQPRLDKWLNPPPPVYVGECTNRWIFLRESDSMSGLAKKWIGRPDLKQVTGSLVYDRPRDKIVYAMTDGTDFWFIDVICFEVPKSGSLYPPKFGAFEKMSLEETIRLDAELKDAETH